MQVVIDGILTNYQKTGSKQKTVLLIHGWADQASTFDPLTKQLSQEYSYVSVDLPGFGASQTPEKAWDIQAYSLFLDKFLKKIDLNPEIIIGHSNGGAITIYSIASQILKAKKIVLIASSGIRRNTKKKSLLKISAKTAKIFTKPLPNSMQEKLKQKSYKAIGSDYLIAPNMKETFKNIVSYDVENDAQKISTPTLIIYGTDDKSTPAVYGKIFSDQIKNSKLEIIESGDHFIHQNKAREVADLINGFIR